MNSVDGKRTRPGSISLIDDHDDKDSITEEDEEHDGVTFKVLEKRVFYMLDTLLP